MCFAWILFIESCIIILTIFCLSGLFSLSLFSHVGGNKLNWEKIGTQSENQACVDPGHQSKVVLWTILNLCLCFNVYLVEDTESPRRWTHHFSWMIQIGLHPLTSEAMFSLSSVQEKIIFSDCYLTSSAEQKKSSL